MNFIKYIVAVAKSIDATNDKKTKALKIQIEQFHQDKETL
jgi:hypothetical protein